MCVHLFLESRYGGVSKRPNSSAIAEEHATPLSPCMSLCWYCRASRALPVSKMDLIGLLTAEAFVNGHCSASGVVETVLKFHTVVWGAGATVTQKGAHLLILQMIASKILDFEVEAENPEHSKRARRTVLLSWLKVSPPAPTTERSTRSSTRVPMRMAYLDERRWSGILLSSAWA